MKGVRRARGAQRSSFSFAEYIVLFVAVTAVATISIIACNTVYGLSGGNEALTAVVTLAVLVLLALALCIAGALWRRASAEKPVKAILAATQKMADGDFDIRLRPRHAWGRYDEYDIICENITRLAAELAKNELLHSDFVANVSHEIKTPLSVIAGYAGTLASPTISEDERRECAAVLISACRRLNSLVTNILRLNKLENQNISPDIKEIDAGELLRACVISFEDAIEVKGLELTCDIDDFKVSSDEGFLEIIFNNLISNAVKFTQKGGVAVSLKAGERDFVFTVRDTGCGMTAETGARIFDKFYQGDTSHSQEGNGLGLALVKRVIDILGGEISVHSVPGEGSEFSVRIKRQ